MQRELTRLYVYLQRLVCDCGEYAVKVEGTENKYACPKCQATVVRPEKYPEIVYSDKKSGTDE